MRKIFGIMIIVCTAQILNAQEAAPALHRCGYEQALTKMELAHPGYLEAVNQTFENAKQLAETRKVSGGQQTLCVPVVFHVVYNQADGNLPDSVLLSQIDVLNEDYNRSNPDTNLTRSEFDTIAGNGGVRFYMATIDPDGNATDGITRTQTSTATFGLSFDDVKSDATGGKSPWPTNKFLNIWICDLSFFGIPAILGVAYPPAGAPNWPPGSVPADTNVQGVVAHYAVVGRNNPFATGALSIAASGRTVTHEVGHYMGLRHIWGDGQGGQGCSVDDGIDDTPNSESSQQQSCNYNANTCVDPGYDYPDMIENFMDYSDEACQNMFSQGQVDLMRLMLETERSSLITDSCSSEPPVISGLFDVPTSKTNLQVWPNPANQVLNFQLSSEQNNWEIMDAWGRVILTGESNSGQSKAVDISDVAPGIYLLREFNPEEELHGQFVVAR